MLTAGFTYQKNEASGSTSAPVVTSVRAGPSVAIEAVSGNLTGHGVQIAAGYDANGEPVTSDNDNAGDITLKAGKDILLESAQAAYETLAASRSVGASLGVSAAKGNSNANGSIQLNSHVLGTGDVRLESGNDTVLKGAVISGDSVTAKVGGDPILSVPDTGETTNKSTSGGFSLGGGKSLQIGGGAGSGSTNWVSQQSGLVSAGTMDVTVGGNTHLGAGKIVSGSGDLTLDTGTLTHENFEGRKQYEGVSANLGLDLTGGKGSTSNPLGNSTLEGSYQLDDTRQTVRATVGPGDILIRDKEQQAALEAGGGSTLSLDELNRDPGKAYEITKDKHVGLEVYLSTNSLNAIGSGLKEMVAPGGFIDKYLLGRELTAEEQAQVKAGVEALANGGSFVGCGQKQGFNLFNWIVTPAYAYETNCTIRQADGTFIELGIKTYEECKDAIYAYLNSLTLAERAQTLRSAGFAAGSSISSTGEGAMMSWWLLNAIEKLDGQPYGSNLKAYLEGTGEGARFAEEFGPQRWAVWNDSSLTWDEKSDQLEKTGLDVSTIIAMAILGGASKGSAKMFGASGAQFASKTIWKGSGKERIDVENPNPGQRPGQIHYQDNDGNKYLYDVKTNSFPEGPKSVNALLQNPSFAAAIQKGLKNYLGEK